MLKCVTERRFQDTVEQREDLYNNAFYEKYVLWVTAHSCGMLRMQLTFDKYGGFGEFVRFGIWKIISYAHQNRSIVFRIYLI